MFETYELVAVLATRPVWPTLRCQQNWQTLIWTVWACSRCPKSSKIEIENRWTPQVAEQELGTSYKPAVASSGQLAGGPAADNAEIKSVGVASLYVIHLHFVFSGLFHTWPWTIQEVWPWQSWHEILIRQASIWWKQIQHLRASNLVPAEAWNQMAAWSGFAGGRVVTFTRGHEFVI
jgi:hypothetical protein